MTMRPANGYAVYWPPHFVTPPVYGYVYLGASVEPPRAGPPFPGRSARKEQLLSRLASLAGNLADHPDVVRATVYRATLMPPVARARHTADFDVAVLVETTSPAAIETVIASSAYTELADTLANGSKHVRVMRATCIRCINDVDKSRPGTYLFNHFLTEAETDDALGLWEKLAGWYTAETDLHNSTLLAPVGDDEFVFVNHARWDHGFAWVMLHQLLKPSFRDYVLANLKASRTAARPVLYKVVSTVTPSRQPK